MAKSHRDGLRRPVCPELETDDPASCAAFDLLFRAELGQVQANCTAFGKSMANGRVVKTRGASHYLFLSHEADVLADVNAR